MDVEVEVEVRLELESAAASSGGKRKAGRWKRKVGRWSSAATVCSVQSAVLLPCNCLVHEAEAALPTIQWWTVVTVVEQVE